MSRPRFTNLTLAFLALLCGFALESCSQNGVINDRTDSSTGTDGGVCIPKSCAAVGATCGALSDGCGGVLACGTCGATERCGTGTDANRCVRACTPQTCAALGATCGMQGDGCGGSLDCGTCSVAGETCGGGGTPNRCGAGPCTPTTCATLMANCGSVSNGCGALLDCGTCRATEVCGVVRPNQCAPTCTPTTCAALGAQCGTAPDGCGGTLMCPTCPGGQTCGIGGANTCGTVTVDAGMDVITRLDAGMDVITRTDGGDAAAEGGDARTDGGGTDRPISIVTPGAAPFLVACAVMGSGQVRCLSGSFGPHLGGGVPDLGFFPPGTTQSVVIPLPEPAQAIATDAYMGCALLRSGRVACWGPILQAPYWGTPTANPRAQIVPGLPTMDKLFQAFEGQFCAGTASGEAWCWGSQINGFSTATVPAVERVPIAEPIVDLALSPRRASCAVLASGQVKCWGNAAYLGTTSCFPGCRSTLSFVRTPTTIPGLSNIRRLSSGDGDGLCAIDRTGRAWCWGENLFGGLGRGFAGTGTAYQTYVPQPMQASGVALTGVTSVVMTGFDTTCVLLTPGEVRCVGNQRDGRLGNGTTSAGNVAVLNFVRVGTSRRPLSPLASELLSFGGGFLAWHPGGTTPVIQAWGGAGRQAPTDPMFAF